MARFEVLSLVAREISNKLQSEFFRPMSVKRVNLTDRYVSRLMLVSRIRRHRFLGAL